MDMFQQMQENKDRWTAQLNDMKAKAQEDLSAYRQDRLQQASDRLDLQGQIAGSRADLAAERLRNAENDSASRADKRKQDEQDRQDAANQKVIDNADKEAEKEYTLVSKISDPDKKNAALKKYGVDPKDDNADQLLQDAIRQQKYSSLPRKAVDYAYKQNKDLAPKTTSQSALDGTQFSFPTDGGDQPPTRGGAPVQQAPAPPKPTTSGQFQEGGIYTDANGNKAKYTNGQFVPI